VTRKGRLGALVAVVIVLLIAVNAIVVDRQTKAANADIGQVLNLSGGDIQVKEEGARTGRTIVLLHGFAASMHWWTPLAERLAGRFHIVRVDLLGHGGSQKPSTGYSMRNQGQLVATALSALGVRHAVVVGHSMGGMVATALTEIRPRMVDGVVLIDTPPNKDAGELPFVARLGFVPVLGETIRRFVPDAVVRNNLEHAFAPGFDVPDQFVRDFRRMTYTSYDHSFEASRDYNEEKPISTRLAEAGRPLLVIFGAEDDIVDPGSFTAYQRVPHASLVRVPGAGHSPMVEQPRAVADLIQGFVQSKRRASRGR
jgi:pimeloyl-ACP methyl ester carboxylesterase